MTMFLRFARDRASRWPFQLVAAVIAAGVATFSLVGGNAVPSSTHSALPPVVAVFTGEIDGGTPVYHLPSISVSADPSVVAVEAQRREARDARIFRAREARADSPG